jgi:hypothetical protein
MQTGIGNRICHGYKKADSGAISVTRVVGVARGIPIAAFVIMFGVRS